MQTLIDQIAGQSLLDWTITITALVYVYLASREVVWCWVWGIVSCSLWAYADFFHYNLWVDGILQLFYVGMGFWGIYTWKFNTGGNSQRSISVLPLKFHVALFAGGMVITLILGYVFDRYTPTALPYPDSFITTFMIIATFLTVYKILENWLYWIVLDTMAVFLFGAREAILVALVMVIYVVISIFGYLNWRKKYLSGPAPGITGQNDL